jgi:uncharacterized protein (DUF433 family)
MEARYLTNEDGERIGVMLEIAEYERLKRAAEENERMLKHQGLAFAGSGEFRRATIAGSPLDVWELVEMYRIEGRETLLSAHPICERQLEAALRYHEEFPEEIDAIIEENSRPLEL